MPAVVAVVLSATAGVASAQSSWESLDRRDAIERSRYIGEGTLTIGGRLDDDWRKARIDFSECIYTGIGDVNHVEIKVASRNLEGRLQAWRPGARGIWFVLKVGDKYEAINHPACWTDSANKQEVCDQVYKQKNAEYDSAEDSAEESGSSSSGDSDGSDAEESVAAYAAAAAAAAAASRVPGIDPAAQTSRFFEQMTKLAEIGGAELPFDRKLGSRDKENEFFEQGKSLLGPAGEGLGDLAGSGKDRAGQLTAMKGAIAQVLNQLIQSTLGAANPAEALKNMKPLKLEFPVPGGSSGPPIPGPGPGPGPRVDPPKVKTPEFKIPSNILNQAGTGSRRSQFRNVLGGMRRPGGGVPGGPGRGPGGPGRGPGGGGPRGPGR